MVQFIRQQMKNNKLNMQTNSLYQAKQKHTIAKLKGCLIKGRTVTSRPVISTPTPNPQTKSPNPNGHHDKKPLITSCPFVRLQEKPHFQAQSPLTKQPPRDKKPLVRSFIIKQNTELTSQSILYNCDTQHNNFVNLLSQCINKRSLTTSKEYKGNMFKQKVYKKNGYNMRNQDILPFQSFNNVKVKKSLENIFMTDMNSTLSPKGSFHKNYSKKIESKIRDSCKNIVAGGIDHKNTSFSVEQQTEKAEDSLLCKYTDITQYMKGKYQIVQKEKQFQNINLFGSNLTTLHNYSNLCNLKYRKKRKQSVKLTPTLPCKGYKNKLTKSNNLKQYFLMSKGSFSGGSMTNSYSPEGKNIRVSENSRDQKQLDSQNEDIKIEDLQIFTQITLHEPRIRKISTSFYSPQKTLGNSPEKNTTQYKYKPNKQLFQNAQQTFGIATEQCQQGYSCYLRTVNF